MFRSLRNKIFGIQAIAITATVIILGSLSYVIMTQAMLSLEKHSLEQIATISSREIDHNLADLQEQFRSILTNRISHRGSDLPLARYLGKHIDLFPELTILNQKGKEELRLVRHRIVNPQELRDWGPSELFRQAMARPNEIIISPVAYSPEFDEPIIRFAMAHVQYFGDKFQGVLIGSIPLEKALFGIDTATEGTDGFLVILDFDHRILYAPDNKITESMQFWPTEDNLLLEALSSSPYGFLQNTLFGQESYLSYQIVQSTGWTVIAALSTEKFLTEPNRLRNLTFFFCLALLIGGMLISHRVSNRLTRDIDHLTEYTHQIAAGNLDIRSNVTSRDEMAILGSAFNEMADQLAHSKETRDHLDTILQSIIDPLLVTDNNGDIQRFNNAAREMLWCNQKNIQGLDISTIFIDEFSFESETSLMALAKKGPLNNHETRILSSSGDEIPVLLSCSFVNVATEEESSLVVILKDISKQKNIEGALISALADAEGTRDQVDAILRSVIDGLIVTDTDQKITHMNRGAEQFFGMKSEERLNRPLKELISNQKVLDHLKNKLLSPLTEKAVEFEISRPSDKKAFIIQARSAPVQSKNGKTTGLITSLRNITEERKMDRMKNEFISTAAHELNTPITTIMGFAECLLEPETFGGFSVEQREDFLNEIFEKTEVLARIVSDLLDLSRMEAGQAMPLEKTPTDLNKTILKVMHYYEINGTAQRFDLNLDDIASTEIYVDRQRIIQVIENLINNAIKYSEANSCITISTKLNGKYALISVADQGIGMTPEQVEKVFDKFYRVNASNTAVGGLGMGMSIVHSIIQSHNGTIDISSVPASGTNVTFGLPLNASDPLQ